MSTFFRLFFILTLTFYSITSSLFSQTYPYANQSRNKLTIVLSQSTDGLNCLENCMIIIPEMEVQMEDAGNHTFNSYVNDSINFNQNITVTITGPKIIPKKVKIKLRSLINKTKSISVDPKKYR